MQVEQWMQELEIMGDETDESDFTAELIKLEIADMNDKMKEINEFKKQFTKHKLKVDKYVTQKVDPT